MTDEQKAVLAHVVIDPDAWMAHAIAQFGEEGADLAMQSKVDRWRSEYLAKKDIPGYKTRAEREK